METNQNKVKIIEVFEQEMCLQKESKGITINNLSKKRRIKEREGGKGAQNSGGAFCLTKMSP